jgi:O-antigen/teichoic acid export membrane protein
VVIASGRFILLLYGPEYAEQGLSLLYLVTLAAIPTVVLSMFMSFLRIVDRMRAVLVIITVWGTLGLLLTYVGIAWQGLLGAGIGWLLSQVLVLVGSVVWWQARANPKLRDITNECSVVKIQKSLLPPKEASHSP